MANPKTILIPLTCMRDIWPGAVALVVSIGNATTNRLELMDAALDAAAEHPQWRDVDVVLRQSESDHERRITMALVDKIEDAARVQ